MRAGFLLGGGEGRSENCRVGEAVPYRTRGRSGDHAEVGGAAADPGGDLDVFLDGAFEVFEVLLEGVLVELGEELGLGGFVVLTDLVDELTFVHGVPNFPIGDKMPLTGSRLPASSFLHRTADFADLNGGFCTMTDLHQNQPNPPASGGSDSLSGLYKMSRTAGLGSTDYVAINGAAVAAAILGVASSLAILANVFLVVPVVGIIFAIAAIRQISHSNGTQGGKLLAWGGMLLSLAFAGIVVGSEVKEALGHKADTQEITRVIDQFSAAAKANDVDKAYALFAPQFQERWDKDRFSGVMKYLHTSPVNGDMEYMKWNGVRMQFEELPNQTDRYANGAMLLKFEKSPEPFRTELVFRNGGDGWKIYSIPNFFPEQQQKK